MTEKSQPWRDWMPGVLSTAQIRSLAQAGLIGEVSDPPVADGSALDLHLAGGKCFELTEGSVKPAGSRYLHGLKQERLVNELEFPDDGLRLEQRKTYLFRLVEKVGHLRSTKSFWGQATAKSSVGRVDVLARLVADGALDYEGFSPDDLERGDGEMLLEVTPITFSVVVKPRTSLNQLRFFLGPPEDAELGTKWGCGAALIDAATPDCLTVDLRDVQIGGSRASAFCALESSPEPVALYATEHSPDPTQYWTPLRSEHGRLRISKGSFYILRSKERISLNGNIAVYCRAIDETIGEMRIHYAGFVHPLFGHDRPNGTPLIFEVRGHDIDVQLRHGDRMARIIFYRMSETVAPARKSDYNAQELALSKHFGRWPTNTTTKRA